MSNENNRLHAIVLRPLGAIAMLMLLGSGQSFAADAANGARLAERWCSSCHIVSSRQQQASGNAPSFASIAQRTTLGTAELAQSLAAPHPKMPDRALSRDEAADIAAYLRSLKNK